MNQWTAAIKNDLKMQFWQMNFIGESFSQTPDRWVDKDCMHIMGIKKLLFVNACTDTVRALLIPFQRFLSINLRKSFWFRCLVYFSTTIVGTRMGFLKLFQENLQVDPLSLKEWLPKSKLLKRQVPDNWEQIDSQLKSRLIKSPEWRAAKTNVNF